jgi:hypothetical protein
MKTEITFQLEAILSFLGYINTTIDALKFRFPLADNLVLQFKRILPFDLLINFLGKTSGSTDFIALNVENLARAIHHSTPTTTFKCEFCHLQSTHFLTI